MDKRKVIFSNRFEKEKLDDYSTNLETDNAIAPTFSEANDFLKFIQKNRRSIPSKERIADKDKFIKTVYELSNSFEIAPHVAGSLQVPFVVFRELVSFVFVKFLFLADEMRYKTDAAVLVFPE